MMLRLRACALLGHALIQRALCLGDLIALVAGFCASFLVIEQPAWALVAVSQGQRGTWGQTAALGSNGADGVRGKGISYSPA